MSVILLGFYGCICPTKIAKPHQHTHLFMALLHSPSTHFHTHSISIYCPADFYSGRRRRSFNCFPCTHFLSVPLCLRWETWRGQMIPWGLPGGQGHEDCWKKNAQCYKYIYGENVLFYKGHSLFYEAFPYLYSCSHSSYYSHDVSVLLIYGYCFDANRRQRWKQFSMNVHKTFIEMRW